MPDHERTAATRAPGRVGEARAPAGASWRRPRPIAVYLVLLTLVTVVPAFLYAALVLDRHNEAQRETVETLVYGTAGSIAQSVDRELSSMLTTLRVLASLPSLHQGDYATFHSRAQRALEGSGNYMILLDENLEQLLNTRVLYGTPLGSTSDPESARRTLETGEPVISGVFYGRTSQKWVFNVELPVDRRFGDDLVLILTRDAEALRETLLSHRFPRGWEVALLDSGGRVLAATDQGSALGERHFLAEQAREEQGFIRARAEREPYLAVAQPSLNADWRVVAWASETVLRQPFRQAFELLLFGGLLIAAAALLSAAWLSRRIGRSVWRLARDAERLGEGRDVEPFAAPITEVETVSQALAEAAKARRAAENEVRFLMREMAHRSKNQLAVISAVAKQSAQGSRSLEDFDRAFQSRLQGLARSTELMVDRAEAGIGLRALVEAQLEPFRPPDAGRVAIEGPACGLSVNAAQMLGMVFHELATNASKYGAFAGSGGRLELAWRVEGDRLRLIWREQGVEHAGTAGRPGGERSGGFGTMVIERMLGQSLGAEVVRDLHDDGIEWRFAIPLDRLAAEQ